MAKKLRVVTRTVSGNARPSVEPPTILNAEALTDLHYLEPIRTRDRVIACFNELFLRVVALERLHAEPPAK